VINNGSHRFDDALPVSKPDANYLLPAAVML
jgi:hypothetical protein